MPIEPEAGEVFGAQGGHELDRDGERGLRANGVVVARLRQSCERAHYGFRQIDQALDIDRIVKHAQLGAVALSHLSLAGVDLAAELSERIEVVRRHFGPVLGDVDDQAREVMKLPRLALAVPHQKNFNTSVTASTVTRSASDLIDETLQPDRTSADASSSSQMR